MIHFSVKDILFFTHTLVAQTAEIHVAEHKGIDFPHCGLDSKKPCRTLEYTVDNIASSGDVILLKAATPTKTIKSARATLASPQTTTTTVPKTTTTTAETSNGSDRDNKDTSRGTNNNEENTNPTFYIHRSIVLYQSNLTIKGVVTSSDSASQESSEQLVKIKFSRAHSSNNSTLLKQQQQQSIFSLQSISTKNSNSNSNSNTTNTSSLLTLTLIGIQFSNQTTLLSISPLPALPRPITSETRNTTTTTTTPKIYHLRNIEIHFKNCELKQGFNISAPDLMVKDKTIVSLGEEETLDKGSSNNVTFSNASQPLTNATDYSTSSLVNTTDYSSERSTNQKGDSDDSVLTGAISQNNHTVITQGVADSSPENNYTVIALMNGEAPVLSEEETNTTAKNASTSVSRLATVSVTKDALASPTTASPTQTVHVTKTLINIKFTDNTIINNTVDFDALLQLLDGEPSASSIKINITINNCVLSAGTIASGSIIKSAALQNVSFQGPYTGEQEVPGDIIFLGGSALLILDNVTVNGGFKKKTFLRCIGCQIKSTLLRFKGVTSVRNGFALTSVNATFGDMFLENSFSEYSFFYFAWRSNVRLAGVFDIRHTNFSGALIFADGSSVVKLGKFQGTRISCIFYSRL